MIRRLYVTPKCMGVIWGTRLHPVATDCSHRLHLRLQTAYSLDEDGPRIWFLPTGRDTVPGSKAKSPDIAARALVRFSCAVVTGPNPRRCLLF